MKTLLSTILHKKTQKTPIWFLRQAGRYLPEYQSLRKKYDFLTICKTPELAAEVTMQPLKRFDLDAAIVFSDILIPPMLLGQKISFAPDHGPILTPPISCEKHIVELEERCSTINANFIRDAIKLVTTQLSSQQTMIGFAGSPYTVASYMIEGGSSKNFFLTKKLMLTQPHLFSRLLAVITRATTKFIDEQIAGGAELIMYFDSWAGSLHAHDYKKYVFNHIKTLVSSTKKPVIYYPGQGEHLIATACTLPINAIALDWRVNLSGLNIPDKIAIQGNLDPNHLFAKPKEVSDYVYQILETTKKRFHGRHIMNVGHGILPQTPISAIEQVISCVRAYDHKP